MNVKKIISGLAACSILIFSLSINVTALDDNITENEVNIIFADENITSNIESFMYENDALSYEFLFDTSEVVFDFDNAMPYYFFDTTIIGNSDGLLELLKFTDNYYVPVLDYGNNFIAYAEFAKIKSYAQLPQVLKSDAEISEKSFQHYGEWEIVSVHLGDIYNEFYEMLTTNNSFNNKVNEYDNGYFVENFAMNQIGIMFSSDENNKSDPFFNFTGYYSNNYAVNNYKLKSNLQSNDIDNYFINEEDLLSEMNGLVQFYNLNSEVLVGGQPGDLSVYYDLLEDDPDYEYDPNLEVYELGPETIIEIEEPEPIFIPPDWDYTSVDMGSPPTTANNPKTSNVTVGTITAILAISGVIAVSLKTNKRNK